MFSGRRVVIVSFLFLISVSSMDFNSPSQSNQNTISSLEESNTNFLITNSKTDFVIHKDGSFDCSFTLNFLGNLSMNDSLVGNFLIKHSNNSKFYLVLVTGNLIEKVPNNVSFVNEYLNWTFALDREFNPSTVYQIKGSFSGYYISYNEFYNYEFDINWGTTVGGEHYTIVSFDTNYFDLVLPLYPEHYNFLNSSPGFIRKINWIDSSIDHLDIKINLSPISLLDIRNYLSLNHVSWNATVGDLKQFNLTNIGDEVIQGLILPTRGIETDTVNFTLQPNESIIFSLKVASYVNKTNLGVAINAGNIFYNELIIDISIYENQNNGLSIFLFMIALLGLIGLIFVMQRDRIAFHIIDLLSIGGTNQNVSETNIPSIESISKSDWIKIEDQWKNILSNKEMNIIKTLFFNGDLDQKSISEELDLTKMSVSRLITKLENKNIVSRHKNGMYNIIKLNKEKVS